MKVKLIYKGVLLYVTTLISVLWICGIEFLVDKGYFIPYTLIMVSLIYLCYKIISIREFCILSLYRMWNKYLDS
jgi:hypothetical protein|nr:MAG TPA: hypothetical protein [Crassvirales sp.]